MSTTVKAPTTAGPRRPRRLRLPLLAALGALIVPIGLVVAFLIAVDASHARVVADDTALARVELPLGGGTVTKVVAFRAPDARPIGVALHDDHTIWPTEPIDAGRHLTIYATVRRPGWLSWLAGATEQVKLNVTAPVARVSAQYLTLRHGQPLHVSFREPVRVFGSAPTSPTLKSRTLPQPTQAFSIPERASAGTLVVAAALRSWERPSQTDVSWFPAGTKATAVVSPALGAKIDPTTPLTLTFSKPVSQALGNVRPTLSPSTPGSWRTTGIRTISFVPTGYGYGLGASVTLHLPSGIRLLSGTSSSLQGHWSVPAGTTLRLQQILAGLGYLPVSYTPSGPPVQHTLAAEENAAIHTPKGTFPWRWSNTPSQLRSMWQPGAYGELTKGAVMAFENDHDMDADGIAGPVVWKALLQALIQNERSTFGYTFVDVSEGSPETESTWHDGHTVASGLVNTGGAGSPTQTGTFAVFEHLRVTTMSGTNPDGTKYDDPGIPWVSYFNGGDALHGFLRAAYGFPQSDGCVEMPYAEAAQVWPYTPVGTIVNVT